MVECANCKDQKSDAVMHCANCGKPICDSHTVHGRYCSEICFSDHENAREAVEAKTELKERRSSRKTLLLALAAVIVLALAGIYYILQLGI